jgi:hypothetical protein
MNNKEEFFFIYRPKIDKILDKVNETKRQLEQGVINKKGHDDLIQLKEIMEESKK